MFLKNLLIIGLCSTTCTTFHTRQGEEPRAIIDHILRESNPELLRNTVLGSLRQAVQRGLSMQREVIKEIEEEDCVEPTERGVVLPEYTEELMDSTNERALRLLGPQKHYPICQMKKKIKKLNTLNYEYRPAYYEEISCVSDDSNTEESNGICSSLGFACIQWNKTIHLTRRSYTSDCWETKTLVIPAGCECMWPAHRLGDMVMHGQDPRNVLNSLE